MFFFNKISHIEILPHYTFPAYSDRSSIQTAKPITWSPYIFPTRHVFGTYFGCEKRASGVYENPLIRYSNGAKPPAFKTEDPPGVLPRPRLKSDNLSLVHATISLTIAHAPPRSLGGFRFVTGWGFTMLHRKRGT